MEYWINELYHHGIKGQRWGVRRYQNLDGTLTAAGRERYGSAGEQKKLADLLTVNAGRTANERELNSRKVRRSPQVRHAAQELKEIAKKHNDAFNAYVKAEGDFYKDKKLYDKYVHKAISKAMKEDPDGWGNMTHDEIFKDFDWFDVFQNDWDPIEILKSSDDPRGKTLRDTEKERVDAVSKLTAAAKQYATAFLGDYGTQTMKNVHPWVKTEVSANTRLTAIMRDEADRKTKSLTDRMAYPKYIR